MCISYIVCIYNLKVIAVHCCLVYLCLAVVSHGVRYHVSNTFFSDLLRLVMYTCGLSTQETEAGDFLVSILPGLCSEFQENLICTARLTDKTNWNKNKTVSLLRACRISHFQIKDSYPIIRTSAFVLYSLHLSVFKRPSETLDFFALWVSCLWIQPVVNWRYFGKNTFIEQHRLFFHWYYSLNSMTINMQHLYCV